MLDALVVVEMLPVAALEVVLESVLVVVVVVDSLVCCW